MWPVVLVFVFFPSKKRLLNFFLLEKTKYSIALIENIAVIKES
jgi:hypothetical protein